MKGSNKFSLYTATMVVVANMIGTGVFTSIGFQVAGIQSGSVVLTLWILGGIISLAGAFCYAELGASIKRSGGEYSFLSVIFSKSLGFVAAWISMLVGFAAPVALAAMALGIYFSNSLGIQWAMDFGSFQITFPMIFSIGMVFLISLLHSFNRKTSGTFQDISTTLKILVCLVLIGMGLFHGNTGGNNFDYSDEILSWPFAIGLYFVTYSFSGWNAAAYIAGEVENPAKNLPRALLFGTGIVTVIYFLLNLVFTLVLPFNEMAGVLDVGLVFARAVMGEEGGSIMGLIISFLLVSSISSMILAGPRVSKIMAEETGKLGFLARVNKAGVPVQAIWIQFALSVVYIFTGEYERVLTFIGFTLNIFTFLSVLGLFVYRYKNPLADRPYKVPIYPVIPILFLLLQGYILYYGLKIKTGESLFGLGFALVGWGVYFVIPSQKKGIGQS